MTVSRELRGDHRLDSARRRLQAASSLPGTWSDVGRKPDYRATVRAARFFRVAR